MFLDSLRDKRSRKVVFLSHCLLNENTRYLGGACRPGCVQEIVEQCVELGIGIVQMPCPEQRAWGGVLKKRMLPLYGAAYAGRFVPVALLYTRLIFRRLARNLGVQIDDYVSSGFSVLGIVGVDGSPSCGLRKTLDVGGFVNAISALDLHTLGVEGQNQLLRAHVTDGPGIFIDELGRELARRGVHVEFSAHDLIDELDGRRSSVKLGTE